MLGKIIAENDFISRVGIIEHFLINNLTEKHEYKANFINNALALLTDNKDEGCRVNKVCGGIGCTEKSLERYFKECLGMTPKKAANIIRVRSAMDKVVNNKWQFKPHLAGYYDGSHFYKEINRFRNER